MHPNRQYYIHNDPVLGMQMVPKPGSPVDRAVKRHITFHDSRRGTRDQTPPQNNLGIPWRAKGSPPTRDEEADDTPPLDTDLLRLARNANGDPTILQQIYAEQEERNKRRQPANGSNGFDRMYRGRDQQLPDDNSSQGEEPEEEDPNGEMVEERLVGQLPEPDEGFTYVLEREPDGSINVVMVPDTNGSDMHTNDRAYRHTSGPDPVLRRMNQIHRNLHRTRDADTLRRTIFRHVPLKSYERLELQYNDEYPGSVDVVLISPATDMFLPQGGAKRLKRDSDQEDDPAAAYVSGASPDQEGEYQMPNPTFRDSAAYSTYTLKIMNQANRLHWARRR